MNVVAKLAKIGATHEEIAASLGISVDTLTKDARFTGVYKTAFADFKISVRRAQARAMAKGNVAAGIWLGKQVLRQREAGMDDPLAERASEVTYRWAAPGEELSETPAGPAPAEAAAPAPALPVEVAEAGRLGEPIAAPAAEPRLPVPALEALDDTLLPRA